jgi:hypothetical protein
MFYQSLVVFSNLADCMLVKQLSGIVKTADDAFFRFSDTKTEIEFGSAVIRLEYRDSQSSHLRDLELAGQEVEEGLK